MASPPSANGVTPAAQAAGGRPRIGESLTAADVMTAGEVAALLHVPQSTVEHWARTGILPSRKVGRRRLYIRTRIEALLLEDQPNDRG